MCHDGASFPPLEFRVEAALDLLLTNLSLVTPSLPSTLRDNTTLIMTFPHPHFPLAQSTKFEVGNTLDISASIYENDTCYESGNAFIKVHDFSTTLVGKSYVDVVVTVPASPNVVDNIPRPP